MPENEPQSRRECDLAILESLRADSSLFDFETRGDPRPQGYVWTFRVKGLAGAQGADDPIEIVAMHQVDVQLPLAYPTDAPEIRWLTPLFHPNVATNGWVDLREIEVPWDGDSQLDVVAERLWDIARFAYRNAERSSNARASIWWDEQTTYSLPIDLRSLRNRTARENVIRYELGSQLRLAPAARDSSPEILYINEDTPVPELPGYAVRRTLSDDEVLFIGDEDDRTLG